MKLRRRPENFAGFESLDHSFLCFSALECAAVAPGQGHNRPDATTLRFDGTLLEGTQVLPQRNSKDPCKMTISRMAFLSRHCCSLSQQQCAAAEAAANQSSRSCRCNDLSLRHKAPSTATSSACACALLAPAQEDAFQSSNTSHVHVHTMHINVAC